MHRRTYERLIAELREAESSFLDDFARAREQAGEKQDAPTPKSSAKRAERRRTADTLRRI
jgi:hypothetical protein